MILLTGATGLIGRELLPLLIAEGHTVRVFVRDAKRLGDQRVDVQIAMGDLADPYSMRHALRGVDTVIHLAASIRDQPHATIEELNGLATARLLRMSERAGVERFVFFSALSATEFQRTRFFRSKALAEHTVLASTQLKPTVFAPSIVYGPGDPWITLLERLALLPAMPVAGRADARFQPIWARDVALCVLGALSGEAPPGTETSGADGARRYELAGPQELSHAEIIRIVLGARGRLRRLVHLPLPVVRASLKVAELIVGPTTPATWEEAELLEVPMTTGRGTADAEALGVRPRAMQSVL